MEKDTSKQMLFEMMHKVGEMPLNENIHNTTQMGGVLDAFSLGHNIYKDVMALIRQQAGNTLGSSAENDVKFYDKVLNGVRDAMYQDMGDSVNPNAGAAPDEMA